MTAFADSVKNIFEQLPDDIFYTIAKKILNPHEVEGDSEHQDLKSFYALDSTCSEIRRKKAMQSLKFQLQEQSIRQKADIINQFFSSTKDHTCMIEKNHALYCWEHYLKKPKKKHYPFPVMAIKTNKKHFCAIKKHTHTLHCWQKMDYIHDALPDPIGIPASLGPILDFSFSSNHICAIKSNETLICWNHHPSFSNNFSVSTKPYTKIITVDEKTYAIRKKDHFLECWNGLKFYPLTFLGPIKDISINADYGCAINKNDLVECWIHTFSPYSAQAPIVPDTLGPVIALTTHKDYACAISKVDEKIHCWNIFLNMRQSALLFFPFTQEPVAFLQSYGPRFCALFQPSKKIQCWRLQGSQFNLEKIPENLKPIITLQLSSYHSCAVENNGTLQCWNSIPITDTVSKNTIHIPYNLGPIKGFHPPSKGKTWTQKLYKNLFNTFFIFKKIMPLQEENLKMIEHYMMMP